MLNIIAIVIGSGILLGALFVLGYVTVRFLLVALFGQFITITVIEPDGSRRSKRFNMNHEEELTQLISELERKTKNKRRSV